MPVVNPAHQFLKFPKTEVGSYALELDRLASDQVPLPLTYCIPASTLKSIAKHNNLELKFKKIRDNINLQTQEELNKATLEVQKLIKQQAYPSYISKKILELYSQKLDKDFIRLTASPVDNKKIDYKREDNIKGEANMMESILLLWARNIDPTDIRENNLFPIAVIIQSQTQPDCSGIAYSLNIDNGDKSKILIFSVFGVYQAPESEQNQDTFLVDQRSWQVSSKIKSNQTKILIRAADKLVEKKAPELKNKISLSSKHVKQLAHLVRKIKLRHTDQIKVHWELVNDRLIVTKIKPYFYSYENKVDKEKFQTIIIGQSVTGGFIAGRCSLINDDQDIKQVNPGTIAVVKKLDNQHQPLVQNCSGFICENQITNAQLLNQIRHYNLPTIINAKHAFKHLKDGQSIILDAGTGKVYQIKPEQAVDRKLTKTTKTKLYLSVNNFDEVSEKLVSLTNGVGLLRSEHMFIKTGLHPNKILKTQSLKLKQKTTKEIISFYHRFINLKKQEPQIIYRSLNLDSNQLAKLDGGELHETKEVNPFLGFRGALRYLNQPHWFKYELSLITKVNSKIDKPVNLMLPFIRNSFELKQLYLLIEESLDSPIYQPPIWLQLTTPENLFNIEDYLNVPLTGVSVNLKNIHALLHGIDPGFGDVYNQYSFNYQLLIPALENLVEKIAKHNEAIKINFILPYFSQELLELAIKLKIEGVVVRPELALKTKQFLIDHEQTAPF